MHTEAVVICYLSQSFISLCCATLLLWNWKQLFLLSEIFWMICLLVCSVVCAETNNSTPHHRRAAAQWLNMTEVQYDLYPLGCLMFVTLLFQKAVRTFCVAAFDFWQQVSCTIVTERLWFLYYHIWLVQLTLTGCCVTSGMGLIPFSNYTWCHWCSPSGPGTSGEAAGAPHHYREAPCGCPTLTPLPLCRRLTGTCQICGTHNQIKPIDMMNEYAHCV